MPPKSKIKREDILATAVALVRQSGDAALNARAVAKALCCSTQPIFSNFVNMEALRCAVISEAVRIYTEFTKQEIESSDDPYYKASGMAYIAFAEAEPALFRLLYMRDRHGEESAPEAPLFSEMTGHVQKKTGLTGNMAELFHLEMWTIVHGIAAMIATNYLRLDRALISTMLSDAYLGTKRRFEEKGDTK